MNSKLLLAFVTGAVVASGLMLVVLKRAQAPSVEPAPLRIATPAPPAVPPSAPSVAAPAVPLAPPPAVEGKRAVAVKPTPMPKRPRPVRERKFVPPPETEQADSTLPAVIKEPPLPKPPRERIAPAAPPVTEVAEVAQMDPAPTAPPPPHSVTIAQGTVLKVRIGESISASKRKTGDRFLATLEDPLIIDGFVIAEQGAHAEGRIVEADPAGRVKGVARLSLELTRIYSTDGQWISVPTGAWTKEGESGKKRDLAAALIASGIGAMIGAAAGGGEGAAIGAGVGGAAGAGGVMATRGPDLVVPVETHIAFTVSKPVKVTEKLN